jgi:hypothetical protein
MPRSKPGASHNGTSKLALATNPAAGLATNLQRAARVFLSEGGTIEEALSIVTVAARQEFGCRIIISNPARILVDGYPYEWNGE